MQLSTHLGFNGQCAEAFAAYAKILDGKITFTQTYGESPMKDETAADWRDKVMHSTIACGNQVLMGADAPPARYSPPQGFTVSVSVADPGEGERIFNALAENGKITMPFQKTFWSQGFGMAVDRFGIPWMVNSGPA